MYYAFIVISVIMFGGCFIMNDAYRKLRGSGFLASNEMAFLGSAAGLIVLLIINGFRFEFTPFTAIMGLINAINGIALTYLSLKALDTINLSLFSLFSMLGGMLLPFAQGIIFYGEKITVAKIVCVVFICVALMLTVMRIGKKKGYIYYIGVFVLNGMSGVLSKLFNEAPFEKASAAGYSIWIAIATMLLSGVLWLALPGKKESMKSPLTLRAYAVGSISGVINKVANFLLVLALMHVDASVQYPMVTGGVMIVSTLFCYFGKRKPNKRELLSVALSFIGLLALFIIPI